MEMDHTEVFSFTYDPDSQSEDAEMAQVKSYIDAAVTQLFYTSNVVHDFFYRHTILTLTISVHLNAFDTGTASTKHQATSSNITLDVAVVSNTILSLQMHRMAVGLTTPTSCPPLMARMGMLPLFIPL